VYSPRQGHENAPPSNLLEFKAWLDDIILTIPEEHRDGAEIDIDTTCEYGDYYAIVEVDYYRPETSEEEAFRNKQIEKRKDADTARDKELLAELKKKYEEKG